MNSDDNSDTMIRIKCQTMDNPRASHERPIALKESKIKEISNLDSLRWCLIMLIFFIFVIIIGVFIAYYYVGYINAIGI